MNTRTPGKHKPSAGALLKAIFGMGRGKERHKKTNVGVGLKQLVRESTDPEIVKLAQDWFHNKRVNVSNPPLGLGSTRKKKGSSNKSGK